MPVSMQDGLMQTHDEETRHFFKNSSVQVLLCPRIAGKHHSWIKQRVRYKSLFCLFRNSFIINTMHCKILYHFFNFFYTIFRTTLSLGPEDFSFTGKISATSTFYPKGGQEKNCPTTLLVINMVGKFGIHHVSTDPIRGLVPKMNITMSCLTW